MAEDNLKGFTISWTVTGLLLVCLLSFTFSFLYNNGDAGLGTIANSKLNSTRLSSQSQLLEVEDDSNSLLNITANTDPEVSDLGSRDSVATGYGSKDSGVSNWVKFKVLISWVFSGDAGKVMVSVVAGIITTLSFFYIVKFIRQGV